MAESEQEKTEQATERQIERFRESGKVVQSQEMLAAVSLCAGALALVLVAPTLARGLTAVLYATRERALDADLGPAALVALLSQVGVSIGPSLLFVLGTSALATALAGALGNGFNVAPDALAPDWNRLDVLSAARSAWFSLRPWVSLLKGGLVGGCVAWAAWGCVRDHMDALPTLASSPLPAQMSFAATLLTDFARRVLPVAVALGAIDYLYQRWKLGEDMKMDKQGVKDEHKEQEGDPHLRARRRQRHRQIALGSLLSKVQHAHVVITNPTHYAVALRYDRQESAAPIVLARGVDHLALKIRAEAARHEIPVIENRPLARALYARTRPGQPIPREFFAPVAQVLAVVLRRRRRPPEPTRPPRTRAPHAPPDAGRDAPSD